jgi:hypothetical protein
MSKFDQNMGRAHDRDSVKQKYWFTKSTARGGGGQGEAIELTIDELFNGCDAFVGFIPIVQRFAREENFERPARSIHRSHPAPCERQPADDSGLLARIRDEAPALPAELDRHRDHRA